MKPDQDSDGVYSMTDKILKVGDSVHLHWQKNSEGKFTVGGTHQVKSINLPDGSPSASTLWSMTDSPDIKLVLKSPEPLGKDVHTNMTQISRF